MSDIYYGRTVHPWAPEIEDWAEESQLEKERLKSYQQTILQVGSLLHQPPFSSSQTSGFFEKKVTHLPGGQIKCPKCLCANFWIVSLNDPTAHASLWELNTIYQELSEWRASTQLHTKNIEDPYPLLSWDMSNLHQSTNWSLLPASTVNWCFLLDIRFWHPNTWQPNPPLKGLWKSYLKPFPLYTPPLVLFPGFQSKDPKNAQQKNP